MERHALHKALDTLGPLVRADGKLVYESHALESTSGDIEYHLKLRYGNAVALYGLRGAARSGAWRSTPTNQRSRRSRYSRAP